MKIDLYKKGPGQFGFSFAGILLTVFVLLTLSATVATLTTQQNQKSRIDETTVKVGQIRLGILGNPDATLNQQTVVGGFASDMGRLPQNLRELVEPTGMPAWSYTASVKSWAGWRGPYVPLVPLVSSNSREFSDGWGNMEPSTAINLGWVFANPMGTNIAFQSLGLDGLPGGAGDNADIPVQPERIGIDLAMADIRGWRLRLTGYYTNAAGFSGREARVQLFYPQDGSFNWQTTNAFPTNNLALLDSRIDMSSKMIISGGPPTNRVGKFQVTVVFPVRPSPVWVPWGLRNFRLILQDANGETFAPANPEGQARVSTVLIEPGQLRNQQPISWHAE